MAIDFDNLNDFIRRTPVILSAADVLDWSETMTNDVKTKIHDGLKACASYDISDSTAIDIVNRFCDNKEAIKVFENATNGTQYSLEQSDETQVRKELNVPADDKDDDLEKSV